MTINSRLNSKNDFIYDCAERQKIVKNEAE